MSFVLQIVKNGKDIILFENNKYRESYSLKNGDVVWRCLGKICKASVKTNKEKTVIYFSNGSHNGSHPVTMQALQTPTPPRPRLKHRPSSATPAAETVPLHASAHASTPNVNPAVDILSTPAQQDSCADGPQEKFTTSDRLDVQQTLISENTALKEELAKLRLEMQVVLDHSIESDQRLLQYTEEIFTSPTALTSTSPSSTETQRAQEKARKAQNKIQELEETVKLLKHPCERCAILKEETNNMVQSLRCLEAENQQLKNNALPEVAVGATPIPVRNNFQLLDVVDITQNYENFVTVIKKKRKKNKAKTNNNNRGKTYVGNKKKKNIPYTEAFKSTAFSNVTIVGDSHVRGLASLVKKRLKAGTAISGVCKPGAGLLDVRPTSTPPRDHCYVLMAGTNDVDAGRENTIFTNLEDIMLTLKKTSRVLVVPLTTRYDLDPSSPVHDTVSLVNHYVAELCHRHRGVELLDTGGIRRHHHTAHGLHLQTSGKDVLAGLIAERLACMEPLPRPQPRTAPTRATPPTAPLAPYMLPHESYAEAAAQHTISYTSALQLQPDRQTDSKTTKSVFLGDPTLAVLKN